MNTPSQDKEFLIINSSTHFQWKASKEEAKIYLLEELWLSYQVFPANRTCCYSLIPGELG